MALFKACMLKFFFEKTRFLRVENSTRELFYAFIVLIKHSLETIHITFLQASLIANSNLARGGVSRLHSFHAALTLFVVHHH